MIPPPAGGEARTQSEASPLDPGEDHGPPAPRPRPHRVRGRLLLALLGVLVACYATGLVVNNLSVIAGTAPIVNTLFPYVGPASRLNLASIASAWDIVHRNYVFRDVDAGLATQASERGIVDYLRTTPAFGDRFSAFFTAAEYAQLQQNLSGRRTGSIGIALEPRCAGARLCPPGATPTVVAIEEVLRGQPAEAAGLRNGDILVAVDGHQVSGLAGDVAGRVDRAAQLIRGPSGKTVHLLVERGGELIPVSVTRRDLHIPSVWSQRFGSVLDLQVTSFDDGTAAAVQDQLRRGLSEGARAVVLDLRHDPGGLVNEAQGVASAFLTPHPPMQVDVVVRRGRLAPGGDPRTATKVDEDRILPGAVDPQGPLVVLVDEGTASAAEIVAAALHDYHRALVVGARTFGKGSVQEDFPLPDGADLHLTVERWYGPAGESIDGNGIAPDRPVSLADEDHRFRLDAQSPPPDADAQLQAALTLAVAG